MIDFRITFQADELFFADYLKAGFDYMFRKFLWQFRTKTTVYPSQTLHTLCYQANVSAIMN